MRINIFVKNVVQKPKLGWFMPTSKETDHLIQSLISQPISHQDFKLLLEMKIWFLRNADPIVMHKYKGLVHPLSVVTAQPRLINKLQATKSIDKSTFNFITSRAWRFFSFQFLQNFTQRTCGLDTTNVSFFILTHVRTLFHLSTILLSMRRTKEKERLFFLYE